MSPQVRERMANVVSPASHQLMRRILPLLFSVMGHALVIAVVLCAWRAFKASFHDSSDEADEQVFEIEIVSPEALEEVLSKDRGKSLHRIE